MTGDVYLHFKGNKYEECGQSKLDGEKVVVYKKLYDDFSYFIRPAHMFFGSKEVEGSNIERFKKIDNHENRDISDYSKDYWEKHRSTFKKPFRLFNIGIILTLLFITIDYFTTLPNNILALINFLPILVFSIDLVLFRECVKVDLETRRNNNKYYRCKKNKVKFQFFAKHSESEKDYVIATDKNGEILVLDKDKWKEYSPVEIKGKYLTTAGFNVIMVQMCFLIYHLFQNLSIANLSFLRYFAIVFAIHGLIQLKRNID